jgi:hypothetical protein
MILPRSFIPPESFTPSEDTSIDVVVDEDSAMTPQESSNEEDASSLKSKEDPFLEMEKTYTLKQLRQACISHNLSANGKKIDLVRRIREASSSTPIEIMP